MKKVVANAKRGAGVLEARSSCVERKKLRSKSDFCLSILADVFAQHPALSSSPTRPLSMLECVFVCVFAVSVGL